VLNTKKKRPVVWNLLLLPVWYSSEQTTALEKCSWILYDFHTLLRRQSGEILAAVHGGSTDVLFTPAFCLCYLFAVLFKDAVSSLSEIVERQMAG
jgi:hypothetical protein